MNFLIKIYVCIICAVIFMHLYRILLRNFLSIIPRYFEQYTILLLSACSIRKIAEGKFSRVTVL